MISKIDEGLIREMQEWADGYSKEIFRQKILRIHVKCLRTNRALLATKIAEKYQKELTNILSSDWSIATNYALFASRIKTD